MMKWILIWILFFNVSFFFFNRALFAEEGVHKSEVKEEHKSENEGAEKEGGKLQSKAEKKTAELMNLQNEVQSLESNVRSRKENLKKLLEEKQHTTDPAQSRELIKSIEKEYKEFKDAAERLEKGRTQLRFRYPEKGISPKKDSEGVGSLKEIESEASSDSEAEQILNLIRKKYGIKKDVPVKKTQKKPNSPHSDELDSIITIKK